MTAVIVILCIIGYGVMGTLCGLTVYAYGRHEDVTVHTYGSFDPGRTYETRRQRFDDPELPAYVAGIFWPLALGVILAWVPCLWLTTFPERRAAHRAEQLAAEKERNQELEALIAEARAELDALVQKGGTP